MELLILLGVPLIAALTLAFVGDRKFAPEVNILGSAATFVASVQLALQVYEHGSILAGHNFFFVDAFSVYLTVLTAFVSMTTAIFSRRYMRREREHGTIGHRRIRFYHAMFQLFIFAMLLCLLTNNVGILWIAMEPHLFPRHILLLLPIASLLFVPALDGLRSREAFTRFIERVLAGGLAVSILLSAIFAWDYARYDVTGDSSTFHRFTWYYPVYDWINKNTPKASRFLVIVYSGHSYYLDRPYRRADPWLSGVVDWSHVASSADVAQVLRHGGYDYVLYDDRDWRAFPAGAEMASAIRSAVRSRVLVPVHAERERLYTSRVTRDFGETSVYVLRLANASASGALGPLPGKNASLKR